MGTLVWQQVFGLSASRASALATAQIARLEGLWSEFLDDSEVSELARCAGIHPIAIDSETAVILMLAMDLQRSTAGAFDVCVGPLVTLWRNAAKSSRLPSESALVAARALLDADAIELSPGPHAMLHRSGQRIDLGGIGKGYAADRCCEIYRENGVRHALIDLGGNVAAVGGRPDGAPWRIGIQAPARPRGESLGYIEAQDCSIVTSGSYERYFEIGGKRYSHILDPRTGLPVNSELSSATVVAASSCLADALATVCMVLGLERGMALVRRLGADALLLDSAGTLHRSPGIGTRFHPA